MTEITSLNPAHFAKSDVEIAKYKEVEAMSKSNRKKMDHGKPDLSRVLDAPNSLAMLANALEYGESKEDRTRLSWKEYDDVNGLVSACVRHLVAYQGGEELDEDGYPHLGAALTNIVMLIETTQKS